jgi:ketosteroid isomerase-like protein
MPGMDAAMRDLEARIRRLEDIESVKQLKARYCAACDDGYDADRLAALFTVDAVWDGGRTFGVAEGRDAIHRHFRGASKRVTIARHQVMNPIIEVDGDRATGHWLLFQPCTNAGPDGEQAMWLAATYADEYARTGDADVDGGWLIARTLIDVAFFTAYDPGWVEQRFLPGREP